MVSKLQKFLFWKINPAMGAPQAVRTGEERTLPRNEKDGAEVEVDVNFGKEKKVAKSSLDQEYLKFSRLRRRPKMDVNAPNVQVRVLKLNDPANKTIVPIEDPFQSTLPMSHKAKILTPDEEEREDLRSSPTADLSWEMALVASSVPNPYNGHQERTSRLKAPTMLLYGHEGEIFTAQFSNDGSCLASAGYDSKIFLWNVYGECENFALLQGHKGSVLDLKFNTDSSNLFTAGTDKAVRVWDMTSGVCVRNSKTHDDIVNGVHACRRGPQLFVSASDDGKAIVHDLRQKDAAKVYENGFPQTCVSFNDTSDQIFVGGIDNLIRTWDLRKDALVYVLRGHLDTITDVSLSPDGRFLLSNSMDCTLRQWDVRPFVVGNSRHVNIYFGHQHNFEKNLLKCAWAPDGSRVAAGSADRFVYIWETTSEPKRRPLYKLPGHCGSVNAVHFHPIEPIFLSAGSDKRIYLGELQ